MQPRHTLRAVLFDLDDTLFDHEQASRHALMRVHESHTAFSVWPFEAFAREHSSVLEELHAEVMLGTRSVDAAREERFRRLFAASGVEVDEGHVRATAAGYRENYLAARRAVDGALDVLRALKPRVRIGIVSNNLLEEQQGKLRLCGFEPFVDALIVSEAVGIAKPDPAIFAHALTALSCDATDAVMVGDSWAADIEGARAAGIRPIWFNRHRRQPPADSARVQQVASLTPIEPLMSAIFDPGISPHSSSDRADARCASA